MTPIENYEALADEMNQAGIKVTAEQVWMVLERGESTGDGKLDDLIEQASSS